MPKHVAIVGASTDRRKFGNKAVRAYRDLGYVVYPVNPHERSIEGLPAYASVADIPGPVDMASFYVPPDDGERLVAGIAAKGIRELWLNPGAESDAVIRAAERVGLHPILACSILAIGVSPGAL